MNVPNLPEKYGSPSVFNARDLHAARPGGAGRVPENVVICFQQAPIQYLLKKYRGTQSERVFGDLWVLKGTPSPTGLAGNFGIGAPAAGVMLEGLIARGAERFLVVGWAGGLQESLNPGDLVVCTRALRDEGTSHHYLPSEEFAYPAKNLTEQLRSVLDRNGHTYLSGETWTTDAPFRETQAEVQHYRARGFLTVEMEAAALFAISQFRGVQCAAAFSVGDSLRNGRWQVKFDRQAMRRGLEKLADAAIQTFESKIEDRKSKINRQNSIFDV